MPLAIEDLNLTGEGRGDWYRNIVSLRERRGLFDSLVDTPAEARILQGHEMKLKPYERRPTIIHRPFEFAETYDAIAEVINWPFENPGASRFSEGHFGVWYGGSDLQTTIYETGYHFWNDAQDSEASAGRMLVGQRRVHLVTCTSPLLDLRPEVEAHPGMYDGDSLIECRRLGEEAHRESLRGFVTRSARDQRGAKRGSVAAILDAAALSAPRDYCYLSYRYDPRTGLLSVERDPGAVMLTFKPSQDQ